MRSGTDKAKLLAFVEAIGQTALGPGRVYFVGGATALLLGVREQTIDIDIKLDPEPSGIFESIAGLKERLGLNVELASPDQFLPELPGWRERSEFIARSGLVEFFHYDFYAQALAKILRGHRNDLVDALALTKLGKVKCTQLEALFEQIRPQLIRYPTIDGPDFKARVLAFVKEACLSEP
ncbi:MAG: DUF6036 family nucleotidyltransferase [Fimbriimonadaceae bacterium]